MDDFIEDHYLFKVNVRYLQIHFNQRIIVNRFMPTDLIVRTYICKGDAKLFIIFFHAGPSAMDPETDFP